MSEPTKDSANENASGTVGCIALLSVVAVIAVFAGGFWLFYSVWRLPGGTSFFLSLLLAFGVLKLAESFLGIGGGKQGKAD